MSENQSGYNPFNNAGEKPKVDAYQWGFNFKSIKGANTDMTYGWKGSGVFGLSTSVYVSPAALLPVVGLGAGVGAGGGAAIGAANHSGASSGASAGAAYTTAVFTGAFVTAALGHMIYPTSFLYEKLITATNVLFPMSGVSLSDLSMRFPHFMNIPAYMTCEMGAKTDFIFGNKYDYCTGSVNKMVNGETVECYGDKVEWYHANLYKYIEGTETKMEFKGGVQITHPGGAKVVRKDVLNAKDDYITTYTQFTTDSKVTAKNLKHSASAKIEQLVPAGAYTLDADTADFVAAKAMNLASGQATTIIGTSGANLKSVAGTVTLQSGANASVVITAAQTKINNMLVLGSPGVAAPPDVSSALAGLALAQSAMTTQLAQAQLAINSMKLREKINIAKKD